MPGSRWSLLGQSDAQLLRPSALILPRPKARSRCRDLHRSRPQLLYYAVQVFREPHLRGLALLLGSPAPSWDLQGLAQCSGCRFVKQLGGFSQIRGPISNSLTLSQKLTPGHPTKCVTKVFVQYDFQSYASHGPTTHGGRFGALAEGVQALLGD